MGRRAGVSHNAPYKHFADKEQLLAAVAARKLWRTHQLSARARSGKAPVDAIKTMLYAYVRRARQHTQLFKLIYGPWRSGSDELGAAALAARSAYVDAVIDAQAMCQLPAGDPERVTALLLAVAHGAADLSLSGHLSKDGKGHASPEDLIDDLLIHIRPPGRSVAQ